MARLCNGHVLKGLSKPGPSPESCYRIFSPAIPAPRIFCAMDRHNPHTSLAPTPGLHALSTSPRNQYRTFFRDPSFIPRYPILGVDSTGFFYHGTVTNEQGHPVPAYRPPGSH